MTILHPTDFSKTAEKALALARDLGQRLGAKLHLVHVQERYEDTLSRPYLAAETLNPVLLERMEENRREEVRRILERLAALTPEGGTFELLWGRPVSELLRVAADYDLIVMGAHGANRLDNYFLGGVAGRLARRSPVPVLTVRDECETEQVRRILLATDFGEASKHALALCRRYQAAGLGLALAHVIDNVRLQDDAGYRRVVEEAMAQFGEGVDAERYIREGEPVEELPKLAAEVGADVIALGLRQHPAMLGLLLGSRADALLRSSPVPILGVPFAKG
jgi:nucleotide-binding universal stress UspA family protein